MNTAVANRDTRIVKIDLGHLSRGDIRELGKNLCTFIDFASTASGRATYYNTKEEQEKAFEKAHKGLFTLDRGIYSLGLLLPGLQDKAMQFGTGILLDNPRGLEDGILSTDQEGKVLARLISQLPPQRMLKMFVEFKKNRVNNSRTRKLILRTLLNSRSLEYWTVKYRQKIRNALSHALGNKISGAISTIVSKEQKNVKELGILRKFIDKHVENSSNLDTVHKCIAFVFGNELATDLPLHVAYREVKQDMNAASSGKLPKEVLMGIKSIFHKDTLTKEDVYKIVKSNDSLTSKQKMLVQKSSKKAGVKIDFDPKTRSQVELYIYAFEMGMTQEIQRALELKAEKSAASLLINYDHVGLVVDTSDSMRGHGTQPLRPIAISLAIKDTLVASSKRHTVRYTGSGSSRDGLIRPKGDTPLAESLVEVLKEEPDAVFIFSDGYENSPAGRVDEVMRLVRKIGNETPIFQVAPVAAAETEQVREISKEISSMPVSRPEGINLSIVRAALEQDVSNGVLGLARTVLPQLGMEVSKDG